MEFKAFYSADATLLGIEFNHMLRKNQHKNPKISLCSNNFLPSHPNFAQGKCA